MEFDYDKFLKKLEKRALSKEEKAVEIYQEIRDAENQKAGFLDQATENPDFFTHIGSQVDSYITYLKVLYNELAPQEQTSDTQVYQQDKAIIDRTMELVKELEEVEKNRIGSGKSTLQKSNLNTTTADL
jgi:predicted proteasome-type protease